MDETSNYITLKAEIGTDMQFEVTGVKGRVKLKMLGLLKKHFLLFHVPLKVIEALGTSTLVAGLPLKVRCISRGAVFGFHSKVIHLSQVPYKILCIEYPEVLQKQEIRSSQRARCLLPASISDGSLTLEGSVADISRTGCHFQAKRTDLEDQRAKLVKDDSEVSTLIALPGINGKQKINSIVRNLSLEPDKAHVGIQFTDVDPKVLKVIDDFVAMSFELQPY
jgi:hypothetical protein